MHVWRQGCGVLRQLQKVGERRGEDSDEDGRQGQGGGSAGEDRGVHRHLRGPGEVHRGGLQKIHSAMKPKDKFPRKQIRKHGV